jgi:hypothetical protein
MYIRFTWSVTLCLLVAVPSQSSAQRAATSFDQLSLLIEAGDTITVRDSNGAETTGKLDSLTAHGLTIVSDGRPQEWGDGDVSRIFQRKQDSLANGALWGLAGGAGAYGVLAAIVCSGGDCEEPDATVAAALAVYAGLGAAVGVGIDALITRRHMIYEQPSRSAALSFAPILTHGKRGVMLMVKY